MTDCSMESWRVCCCTYNCNISLLRWYIVYGSVSLPPCVTKCWRMIVSLLVPHYYCLCECMASMMNYATSAWRTTLFVSQEKVVCSIIFICILRLQNTRVINEMEGINHDVFSDKCFLLHRFFFFFFFKIFACRLNDIDNIVFQHFLLHSWNKRGVRVTFSSN